ncbi:TIGR04141 family sporadically distributed protein [Photobacterium damselae]
MNFTINKSIGVTTFLSVSGGDSVYSFSKLAEFSDLPSISQSLINYYSEDSYKANFSWVDNIRRLKNDTKKAELDDKLREQVESKNAANLAITAPEVISWDKVIGFSFTHFRNTIYPTLDIDDYFNCLDSDRLTLSALKSHKLYVHQDNTSEVNYSLYKSFYFEVIDRNSIYILFSGDWFEVDNDYIELLNEQLDLIDISSLDFPTVHIWSHDGKNKIESEGSYNERTALLRSYYLLDKKTIKSRTTTSPIELCDLLTDEKQFIHVKHKKGGSSGLSHLFSQGYVAAEVVLSDREFRKKARRKLQSIKYGLNNLIPLDHINSHEYEVIFLILGEDNSTVKSSLPFFSKINLVKAYENLTQKGFKVTICGAGKESIEPPQEIEESNSENTELEM